MDNFNSWLRNRDSQLLEVLDQEHLQAHNFDALGAAKKKVQDEKENEEKEKAIKNLEFIKENLEKWVGHDEHGAEKIKWLAAIMHLQDPKGGKVDGAEESAKHHYKNTFKNLESLNSLFKKENIMNHMGDPMVLFNLRRQLETNWNEIAHDIHQNSTESERDYDHTHGKLGKHFAEFVVSTMIHVADVLLKGLKGEINGQTQTPETHVEPKAEEIPAHVSQANQTEKATDQPLGMTSGQPEAKQGMMGEVGKWMGFKP